MDWTQFGLFLLSVGGLFLWSRAEALSDIRKVNEVLDSIAKESKDFHGRLCTLEERYIQLMQKMWENK